MDELLAGELCAALGRLRVELSAEIAAAEAVKADSPYLTDRTLRRFLLGHGIDNVVAVAEIVRENLAWRAEVGADAVRARLAALPADEVSARDLPHFELVCAHMIFGTTSLRLMAIDNRPVVVRMLGMIDPSSALEHVDEERFDAFWVGYLEMVHIGLDRLSEAQGRLVRYHVIIDLSGLGLKHASASAIQCFKRIATISQRYPESMHRVQVVNAPWVFESIFALVSRFIAPHTRRKINVAGAVGSAQCDAALGAFIDRDALPVLLGGLQPNGECLVVSSAWDSSACSTAGSADWTQTVKVPRATVKTIAVAVAAAAADSATGAVAEAAAPRPLRWEWRAAENDIDFSVVFAPLGAEIEIGGATPAAELPGARVVVPSARCEAHSGVLALSPAEARSGGTLLLVLDNHFSWVTPKTLTLRTWRGAAEGSDEAMQ